MHVGPSWAPLGAAPAAPPSREPPEAPVRPASPPATPPPSGPAPTVDDAPWPQTLMEMSAVAQHLAERRAERVAEAQRKDDDAVGPPDTTEEQAEAEQDPAYQAAVAKLQARDAEVRAHEAAHAAVAGPLGGAPSFVYQQGPDGKQYAIGGSVPIDTSEGSTPEETLARAERVRAAALAPAKPSGADRAIASLAANMAAKARQEQAVEEKERQVARYGGLPDRGRSGTRAVL